MHRVLRCLRASQGFPIAGAAAGARVPRPMEALVGISQGRVRPGVVVLGSYKTDFDDRNAGRLRFSTPVQRIPAAELFEGGGYLRSVTGFLGDSQPNRYNRLNESNFLHRRNALFSSSSNNGAVQKQLSRTASQSRLDKQKQESSKDQVADIQILKTLAKYLWLKDNVEFQMRVLLAMSLLVGAKVLNVQVPFLFKLAVDWLSATAGSSASISALAASNPVFLALFVSPAAVLAGYGIARTGASACSELRNAVFSKVALRAIRTVSRKVFFHLHELDLRFHLSRQTGAVNRIIDRGSRAINFILSAMVFNVVPTILEVFWRTNVEQHLHGLHLCLLQLMLPSL